MNLKHILKTVSVVTISMLPPILPIWAANPSLKTGMDIKEMQQIEVRGVKIENFAGFVTIKSTTTDDQKVRVSLKGTDTLLNQIIVSDDHGTDKGKLYISFNTEAPILKDVKALILTLEMPAKMPLDFNLVGGKAEIGNRETKDTKVTLNGFGDIHLTSVQNLDSSINGSGEITVMDINGEAKIAIRGTGKYALQKGTISHLTATTQGTGVIDVKAEVVDADLKSQGAGAMTLSRVSGNLTQTINGAGTISIAEKTTGSVKSVASGSGKIEMNCQKKK